MASDLAPPDDRCSIEPTAAQLSQVADLDPGRPVVMVNLLRFREVADYSDHPDLAPQEPISGSEAYERYGEAAQPHIEQAGATVELIASCGPTVIGPGDERWDLIILVRYPDAPAFLAMISAPEYQALAGHRSAALVDSRLVVTNG